MGVWTWQQNNESRGGWDRLRPARGFVQLETRHGQGNRQQCWELFPPSACAYPGKNFSDLSLVLAESRYGKSLLLQSSSCPVPEASVSGNKRGIRKLQPALPVPSLGAGDASWSISAWGICYDILVAVPACTDDDRESEPAVISSFSLCVGHQVGF